MSKTILNNNYHYLQISDVITSGCNVGTVSIHAKQYDGGGAFYCDREQAIEVARELILAFDIDKEIL